MIERRAARNVVPHGWASVRHSLPESSAAMGPLAKAATLMAARFATPSSRRLTRTPRPATVCDVKRKKAPAHSHSASESARPRSARSSSATDRPSLRHCATTPAAFTNDLAGQRAYFRALPVPGQRDTAPEFEEQRLRTALGRRSVDAASSRRRADRRGPARRSRLRPTALSAIPRLLPSCNHTWRLTKLVVVCSGQGNAVIAHMFVAPARRRREPCHQCRTGAIGTGQIVLRSNERGGRAEPLARVHRPPRSRSRG